MRKQVIAVAAVIGVIIIGIGAYALFRTPAAPGGPIQAIPYDAPAPTANGAAKEPAGASSAATAPVVSDDAVIFEIVPDETEARFAIEQFLHGAGTTVVGTTNQVAGQIAIDPSDPTASKVGVIQVNARTLVTDEDLRNRVIANQILKTNDHEFVTFTPTKITGLPSQGAVGKSFTFQVAGDLTITDVTKSVTFDATVTPVSETRIEGAAVTTVNYKDFGLLIPDAPVFDTVADEVRLELKFVAKAV